MFIRYLVSLFFLLFVVPSFAGVVQVSTNEPDARDVGMLLQLVPAPGDTIDEIRVGSAKMLSVDLQGSSMKVSKDPATGLHYFDVLVDYFVPSPTDARFRSSYLRLQCPVVRTTYLDNSKIVDHGSMGVLHTVDHKVLNEEVLLRGIYEFLPLATVSTQVYLGGLPMKGEITQSTDLELLCSVAELTYLKLKWLTSNREIAFKKFGISE